MMLVRVVSDDVEDRTFGVTVEAITAMDRWIETIAAQWGLSERVAFGVRLCVAELAANVLEHGVARSHEDQIVIRLDRLRDGIEVEFSDSRECFDPTVARTPVNNTANGGGRGLLLLQSYASDLTYAADARYNRTRFKVKTT
jgi:anti-sigma regulatory factor (Ser/Thr protein kinase)